MRSLDILHAFLWVIFLSYLIDIVYETLSITSFGILAWFALFIMKIFINAGLMGSLIEVVSTEELYFQWKKIVSNAKEFGRLYGLLLLAPLGIILILGFYRGVFPREAVQFHADLVITYIMARWMVSRKYLIPDGIFYRKVRLKDAEIVTLFALFLLNYLFFLWPVLFSQTHTYLPNILGFASRYIQFLIFIYVSNLMVSSFPQIGNRFKSGKELYIINPYPYGGDLLAGFAYSVYRWNPPFFVVLKALTPKNYKVRLFNQVIWRERYYKSDALVAIACYTSNSPEAYKIAKEFKRRGATVVMGGSHAMFMTEEALDYCDCVVVGDVEGVWRQVVKDFENKTLKKKYFGEPKTEDYQAVYDELYNSPPEIIRDFLEPTRGCKFKCHFCAVPGVTNGRVRTQPIQDFVSLLKKVQPYYNKDLYFIDSNMYSDPAYSKELFKAIKPLKVTWQCATTVDFAKNEETLKLAKESGCKLLLCGFEIPVGSEEKDKDAKLSMADRYLEYARKIQDTGINIKGSFIFGWDSDNINKLWRLWKYCLTMNLYLVVMSILTPIPGSQLFNEMLSKGRITNLNWRSYAFFNLVFKHPHLDNFIFPKLFFVIRYAFFFTTSKLGRIVFCIFLLIGTGLVMLKL